MTDEQIDALIERQIDESISEMDSTDNLLNSKDRLYLIAGLIGEYQQLCHDDSQPDDLTPEQHHAELVNYTDEELIIDADLHDSPYESCEEFYLTHASYCPEQYFVD